MLDTLTPKRLVACLILAVVLLVLATPLPADDPDEEFLQHCPHDILAYFETRDLHDTFTRMKNLALYGLLTSEEVKDIFNETLRARQRDVTKELDDFSRFTKLMDPVWEFLRYGFTGRAFFVVPEKTDDLGRGRLIMAGEIATGKQDYCKEFMAVFPDLLRELSKHLGERKVLRMAVSTVNLDGIDVTMLKRREDVTDAEGVCFVVLDRFVVITVGLETMKEYLDGWKGMPIQSLAANEDFMKCYRSVKWRDMFWYMNTRSMIAKAKELFDETGIEMPVGLKGLVLLGLNTCAGGTTLSGRSISDEIVSFFDKDREEASLDFMEGTRCPMSATGVMSDKAYLYYSMPFPLVRIYESYEKNDPESLKLVEEIEEKLGISIKEQLLPMFSSDLEFCFTMQGFLPDALFSIRILGDPADVDLFLQALPLMYPDRFAVSKFKDTSMYLVKGRGVVTFTLAQAFAIHEGKLLVGSITAIQDAIMGVENKLSENEEFAKARTIVDETTNGFIYIDTEKLFILLKNFALSYIQKSLGGRFDPAVIPEDYVISEHAIPIAASISVTSNKVTIRTKGFINGSTFFTLAGMRLISRNLSAISKVVKKRREMRGEPMAPPPAGE